MAKPGKIVSLCLFVGTLVTFILGLGSPWWHVAEYDGAMQITGLWLVCGKNEFISWTCLTIGSVGDAGEVGTAFDATRAMMCLGLIAAIVDLVLYILVFKKELDVRIAGGVCGIVGMFALISVAIFASKFPVVSVGEASANYGWAFIMACLSCAIGIVNAILTFILARSG